MIADRFLQQTTANAEQIRDIEERVQSLAEILASPVGDQDSGEKARREALRKFALHQRDAVMLLIRPGYSQEVVWDCCKTWTVVGTARTSEVLEER